MSASQVNFVQLMNEMREHGMTEDEINQAFHALINPPAPQAAEAPFRIELDAGVFVHEDFSATLKSHQVEGLKFAYRACIKGANALNTDVVGGGILNHCMGLGKTFTAIAFLDTISRHAPINQTFKNILIVCPVGAISTWQSELEERRPSPDGYAFSYKIFQSGTPELFFREFQLPNAIPQVAIVGFERFRGLDRSNAVIHRAIVNPGPDLLIVDEAHRVKNESTALFKAFRYTRTKRRLSLTGTLFQNNLDEYRSCVNFVQPILLERDAFDTLFKGPIEAGSTITAENVTARARRREFVLYRLVERHVHRRDHQLGDLPQRSDFVIFIRLLELQRALYVSLLSYIQSQKEAKIKYFSTYHLLQKICAHPKMLVAYGKRLEDAGDSKLNEVFETFQADGLLDETNIEAVDLSGKLIFLLKLVRECVRIGDKLIIFTQYLESIALIQSALKDEFQWTEETDYYVISGNVDANNRRRMESIFKTDAALKLVIFSTKAGCVGTNFQAANRVVIFDVSPNPANDEQATYRVYRIGQQKPVFVYRLVAEHTLEARDYSNQITKISIGKRVEHGDQIERFFTEEELKELYAFKESPIVALEPSGDDHLDAVILQSDQRFVSKVERFDLQFEHREELELTDEEKSLAWQEFAGEARVFNLDVDAVSESILPFM